MAVQQVAHAVAPLEVRYDGASVVRTEGRLRYDATVPRQLVHRSAVAEVFITDSAEVGPGRIDVAAQLPRGHVVGEHSSQYDPLLVIEAVRQAGVFVAHRHLDVEVGTPFVFRAITFAITDLAGTRIGPNPARALFALNVEPQRTGAGRMQALSFSGEGSIDDVRCLAGAGKLVFLNRAAYAGLRERGRAARLSGQVPHRLRLTPASPGAVGRRDPRNVVITAPERDGDGRIGASVVVDASHPHLFDHALDHIPGNLELEACRQIAIAAVARTYGFAAQDLALVRCTADMQSFAELDLLTRVGARVGELRYDEQRDRHVVAVSVDVRQAGAVVATAAVEVAA
jgi:hypothetical protein